MQNFWALGAPRHPAPIGLRQLEAPPPDPKISPLPLRISGYAPDSIFGEDLFLVFTWILGKKCSIFGEDRLFALHLICSPEKNRGRGSSPPMLKIGQNWGKIANYPPPNAQQRFAPLPTSVVYNVGSAVCVP